MKLVFISDARFADKRHCQDFEDLLQIIESKIRKTEGIVNIIFTGDRVIKILNRQYRNKDQPTDVLTFTYQTEDDLKGEIYISVSTARRQAKAEGWKLSDELNKLFVHGYLHFRGYDHVEESDFRVMKLLEDEVILAFGGKPYNCS